MTSSSVVVLFFIANLFYALAYLVRDIYWLRILTIIAASSTMPYFFMQPQVMYSALFWQSAFVLINLFNLIILIRARRPVPLTEDETSLKDMVFRHLTTRETAALLRCGRWCEGAPGDTLTKYGGDPEYLYLLFAGNLTIKRNDQTLAYRGPGSFIGEIGFMTGSAASADTVFSVPSRYIEWRAADLRSLFEKKTDLKAAFESLLAVNVAHKLATEESPLQRA